jgi:hypothetical protein
VLLETSTNGQEIKERWERRAAKFGQARRKAQDSIRSVILEESRKILATKIYSKPIPRRPRSGKPKWVRKQELYQAEQCVIQGGDVILRNTSKHAKSRYDLGTPQGRPIRSEGVESVQWQHEALRNRIDQIREFYRVMNREIIRG